MTDPKRTNNRADADALHDHINERQDNRVPAASVNLDDAATAEALLTMAQQMEPDAAFVADLEAQLVVAARAKTPSTVPLQRWLTTPWSNMRMWSLKLAPIRGWTMAGAGIAVALLMVLFAVPTTRAAILNRLYALAFVEEAAVREATISVVEPTFVPDATGPMTLAEIRDAAPFAVPTPTWLPNELRFTGGNVIQQGDDAQVALVYHPTSREIKIGSPVLLVLIERGEVNAPPLLPIEHAHTVSVNGYPASYLHGGWRSPEGGAAESTITDAAWDETLDMQWLSWRVDDFTYLVQADGLGLTAAEVVQIAESLE